MAQAKGDNPPHRDNETAPRELENEKIEEGGSPSLSLQATPMDVQTNSEVKKQAKNWVKAETRVEPVVVVVEEDVDQVEAQRVRALEERAAALRALVRATLGLVGTAHRGVHCWISLWWSRCITLVRAYFGAEG